MKFLITILILNFGLLSSLQILKKHQWENRILLVLSEKGEAEKQSKLFTKQIDIIKNSIEGFVKRKLIVYEIFPDKFKLIDFEKKTDPSWIKSSSLFDTYNKDNKPFKVILIGLDGGIKEEKTEFFSSQELFDIIDSMSMRKAEIRRKNNP